ncbi:MAG: hypothetical protein JKY37_14820 [Nannocystaceae bacterium]|nr:hypothetical protein [Nannocystaceae bacterium]
MIPQGPAGGTYHLGGQSFSLDTAPVVHLATPPAQRVFTELGLWQQIRRQDTRVDSLVHLVLPEHRLDLVPGGSNWPTETERGWPGDAIEAAWSLRSRWAEATDAVLDELLSTEHALMADGFWSRRFLNRVAGQLPGPDVDDLEPLSADHPLRLAARAAEPWLLDLSPAQLGKAASLRLFELWRRGPHDVPGGVHYVRKALLQRIELHSGEVKPELRVAELQIKRGRVVGVSLLGKRSQYGCEHMVIATDPRPLLDDTLPREQIPKQLANTLVAIESAAYRYVLHLEVKERGLSPALAGMAVCVPSSAGPHAVDAEWAEHGVGMTYLRVGAGAREDLRRVSITHIAQAGADPVAMREQVLAELDERAVLPFCRDHIELMHSPHDGLDPCDGHGNRLTALSPDAGMPLPPATIEVLQGEPSLGLGMLPHLSGIKNVCLAGRLTLPGLGMEGEFAAGTMAAGLVAPSTKSPFSRSGLLKRA